MEACAKYYIGLDVHEWADCNRAWWEGVTKCSIKDDIPAFYGRDSRTVSYVWLIQWVMFKIQHTYVCTKCFRAVHICARPCTLTTALKVWVFMWNLYPFLTPFILNKVLSSSYLKIKLHEPVKNWTVNSVKQGLYGEAKLIRDE